MTDKEHKGRDAIVIEELLRELDELRELDRRRNGHAPGSTAHDAATLEVDLRSRRLMDRFRDFKERRLGAVQRAAARETPGNTRWTRPVDARSTLLRNRGALLN